MRPLLLLLLACAAAGCDSSGASRPATVAFVGNRGAGDAGGTVTRLDVASGESAEALGGLGAAVQSVVQSGRRLYVLLNDPADSEGGRIDVIDLDTGARVRQIGAVAPRRLAVSRGTAFVTNATTFSLTPIDLGTGQSGPAIQVGDQPEGVVALDGRVVVATWNGGFGHDVRIVDALRATGESIVEVGCDGPRNLISDGEGDVWVFCTGRPATSEAPATNGAVVVLDGAAVAARFALDAPLGTPGGHDVAFDAETGEAFAVVGQRLVRFDTRATTRLGDVAIPGAQSISALAIDGAAGRIYLGRFDPSDPFGEPGAVTVHDLAGALLASAPAGVAPVSITFLRP